MSDKERNLKWWIKLIIQVLTVIASFIGGQASAKSGLIDMFHTQIENSK